MARKIQTRKRFPEQNIYSENFLLIFLINRVLKNGKKSLSRNLVYKAMSLMEAKTKKSGLYLLEKAIKNIRPKVQLKIERNKRSTMQIPIFVTKYKSTSTAIRWLLSAAKKRPGKNMSTKLASEILDASKGFGNAIRKKEEIHKAAEANKAFIQKKYTKYTNKMGEGDTHYRRFLKH